MSELARPDIIFLGWDGFDQRNEAYCHILNASPVYIGRHHPNRLAAVLAWFYKTVATALFLFRRRPDILMIKNTQWVIAMVAMLLRPLFGYRLVLDSHSCAFDGGLVYPGWIHRLICRRATLSLVTNGADEDQIRKWGGRVYIIPFPPKDLSAEPRIDTSLPDGFNICFAHTYAIDEPYQEVVEAARALPEVTFHITGNPAKASHPLATDPNIHHTGFISRSQYLGLVADSNAVMTLTTRDNTMQKAGNEAIFMGTPLITSDLPFLRSYFCRGTVFVKQDARSIEAGIREMMSNQEQYRKEMKQFADELHQANRQKVLQIIPLCMNPEEQL